MSLSLCRRLPLRTVTRGFSTYSGCQHSLQIQTNDAEDIADVVPPYPYGPAQWYKQSDRGLYGGKQIQFGHNVGEKFKTKTRRTFRPNIQNKRLWSRALNRWVHVRVSTRVLRTVDKVGGLDEYLLGEKEARVKELGMSGWWLRWAIMQTKSVRERFAAQRDELGITNLRAEVENMAATVESELADLRISPTKDSTPKEDVSPSVLESQNGLQGMVDESQGGVPELLAVDDAFQVESTPELPPLQFRLDHRRYIVLTPNGWAQLPPPREVIESKGRKRTKKALLVQEVQHLVRIENGLERQQNAATVPNSDLETPVESIETLVQSLSEEEKTEVIRRTKQHFQAKWNDAAVGVYDQERWERSRAGRKERKPRGKKALQRQRISSRRASPSPKTAKSRNVANVGQTSLEKQK